MNTTAKLSKKREVCVVIPVYNEAKVIRQVINEVQKEFSFVVCVNDGSSDTTEEEILKTQACLINHPINLGQGASLQTGIEYGLQFPEVEYFVTFDADGQHKVSDVLKMMSVIRDSKIDIVIGSRFLGSAEGISVRKRMFLQLAIKFTNLFSKVKLTDTHNGIRVFNRKFASELKITIPGMGHASEIIDFIGNNKWNYREVPVDIVYTPYSVSKGQSIINSVNIVTDITINKYKK